MAEAIKVITDIQITFKSIPIPVALDSIECEVTYQAGLRGLERLNTWTGTQAVRLPKAQAKALLQLIVDSIKNAEAAMDGGGYTVVVPVVPSVDATKPTIGDR